MAGLLPSVYEFFIRLFSWLDFKIAHIKNKAIVTYENKNVGIDRLCAYFI